MTLSGSSIPWFSDDYVQFERDILFITPQFSPNKIGGDVELPVPRRNNGVMRFVFPFMPLARSNYNNKKGGQGYFITNFSKLKLFL